MVYYSLHITLYGNESLKFYATWNKLHVAYQKIGKFMFARCTERILNSYFEKQTVKTRNSYFNNIKWLKIKKGFLSV